MNTSVPYSALSHLECSRCGISYDARQVQGTCTCGAPLLARYDIDRVSAQVRRDDIAGRPPDLWRYHELLPVTGGPAGHQPGGGHDPAACRCPGWASRSGCPGSG